MPLVADHDELVALAVQLGHFDVDLGDQRAGGVEHLKAAGIGLAAHFLADAVGAEDQGGAGRHLGQVFDEDGSLGLEVVDHIGVVHDLVAHVDGRAKFLDRPLDDFDGPVDARAKAARLGQNDFLRPQHAHSTPIRRTSKVTGWPASGWLKSNCTAPSAPTCSATPA